MQTGRGATWSVSATVPSTLDDDGVTGFPSLTYTEVGDIGGLGSFGPTFSDATFTPLKSGVVNHRKGEVDYGEMTVSVASDITDAGQALLLSGVDGANSDVVYSHKITTIDGIVRYFTGQVFSFHV